MLQTVWAPANTPHLHLHPPPPPLSPAWAPGHYITQSIVMCPFHRLFPSQSLLARGCCNVMLVTLGSICIGTDYRLPPPASSPPLIFQKRPFVKVMSDYLHLSWFQLTEGRSLRRHERFCMRVLSAAVEIVGEVAAGFGGGSAKPAAPNGSLPSGPQKPTSQMIKSAWLSLRVVSAFYSSFSWLVFSLNSNLFPVLVLWLNTHTHSCFMFSEI